MGRVMVIAVLVASSAITAARAGDASASIDAARNYVDGVLHGLGIAQYGFSGDVLTAEWDCTLYPKTNWLGLYVNTAWLVTYGIVDDEQTFHATDEGVVIGGDELHHLYDISCYVFLFSDRLEYNGYIGIFGEPVPHLASNSEPAWFASASPGGGGGVGGN